MAVAHVLIELRAKPRGYHLITEEVLRAVRLPAEDGILLLTLQHTSAGLCLNENADPDVRVDFETLFNRLVPEGQPGLTHTIEGPDDMPAHIKSALTGVQLSIPFKAQRLLLGTWQGIYLCEFRNRASSRKIVASILT